MTPAAAMLDRLPAAVMFDRLPVPLLRLARHGTIEMANPDFAAPVGAR